MKKLNKYIVPIDVIVYGESESDAIAYVQDAIDHSDLLAQDGILGVNPDIEEEFVDLYDYEEDV
jgi:hypothetical protein